MNELMAVINNETLIRAYIRGLNQNQLSDLSGKIFGHLYWMKRRPNWRKDGDTNKCFSTLRWTDRLIRKALKTGRFAPERSIFGSTMVRWYYSLSSLDFYEMRASKHDGWRQVVNDGYRGIFANADLMKITCYTEGDIVDYRCTDKTMYQSELERHVSFYNEY